MVVSTKNAPKIDNDRYLCKVFEEDNLDIAEKMRLTYSFFFKTIEYEISEHVYKPKYKPFQKRALDCYLQGTFYTYTDNTGNKKFL